MHSRLSKVGTSAGVAVGLVASSLIMAPVSSAEEPTTPGNNLSVPVLWSEDELIYQLDPPGAMETVYFSDTEACSEDTTVQAAVQKSENNSWQADNMIAENNSVTSLDWGDNIEVKDWTVGNPVRIETALYALLGQDSPNADIGVDTMTGYEMCHVSGRGPGEVWGAVVTNEGGGSGMEMTDTDEPVADPMADDPGRSLTDFESEEAMVYTAGARLTIQRIDEGATPTWDAAQHRWVGQGVADPEFNGAVHEKTADGPGTYGAEINVSGKVVFGFNWQTDDLYNGEYRITFSLDGANGDFPGSGTSLANATIRQSVEETAGDELAIRTAAMERPGGANTAFLDGAKNLSYIDVGLTGGQDPPVTPDPEPTNPPAPPTGDTGTAPPSGSTGGSPSTPGAPDSGNPGAGVPVEVASPVQAQQRIRQRAKITAPKSSKQQVRTRLMLTEEPIFTDQGVTIRWRVTKRSEDNCTIRNRDGEVSVKFTKRGRCTVVAWAPSPNPLVFAPFNEKRIYKVRNTL